MTLFATLRRARDRRKAARQLRSMPPHLLRDIGVEPGRIDEAVSGMLAAQTSATSEQKPAPDALLFRAAVFSRAAWPYPRRRTA